MEFVGGIPMYQFATTYKTTKNRLFTEGYICGWVAKPNH